MHDTKVAITPQWFNTQQNNWIQNIRPPMMPPMGHLKIPPVPLNMPPMQPNLFYPKWNPKLPPTPAFMQLASYSQSRQLQMKHQMQQNHQQQKGPQNGSKWRRVLRILTKYEDNVRTLSRIPFDRSFIQERCRNDAEPRRKRAGNRERRPSPLRF